MYSICTHTSPDLDAIVGTRLLEKYYFDKKVIIHFVKSGDICPCCDATVDTGGFYGIDELSFDHHQFTGDDSKTSATELVYEFLLEDNPNLIYLKDFIQLINDCDLGLNTESCLNSRNFGIHAFVSSYKSKRLSDIDIYLYGSQLFDMIDESLKYKYQLRKAFDSYIRYESKDKLFVLLENGSSSLSFIGYEMGYKIIMFVNTKGIITEKGINYSIGLTRSSDFQFHLGDFIQSLDLQGYQDEINQWYLHPAGFYTGRGSTKNPNPKTISIDYIQLAERIDFLWSR